MPHSQAFHPPARLLLGPGPSNVEERVLRALSAPMIGYFDPTLPEVTGEIGRLLQAAFGTTADYFTIEVDSAGYAHVVRE